MKRLFKNARIIDGRGELFEKGWLLTVDDKIAAMGGTDPIPEDMSQGLFPQDILDLAGKTILPGLIDCHVHLALDASPDPIIALTRMTDATAALHMAENAKRTLRAGITTIRDMGSRNFIDLSVRDAVRTGLIDGPRMLCAGQMICITGGHGWQMGCQADGPVEIRKAVRKQIMAGVDQVKFMATGGVLTKGGRPGVPQLDPEELKAGVDEAHKIPLKTCAHSQSLEGTRISVAAGIDSVEHGVSLDDGVIEEMLKREVFLVPTLSAPFNIMAQGVQAGIPVEYVEKTRQVNDAHVEALNRARKAGVRIAAGTDAGTPFNLHGQNANELVLLVENGFSAAEALACATSRAAELLDLEDILGSISPGKQADFLIVDGNPLADIRILTDQNRIWNVFKGGVES
ncbi:MAG: amidohydrolase family protein [Deltaproteobacteria bacterium]|nr:amidohydrolase family protein [Deltaproteobacteria bacterium]